MSEAVYTVRVTNEDGSHHWVFRSLDPLPEFLSVNQVMKLASNRMKGCLYWWCSWDGHQCGLAKSKENLLRTLRRREHGERLFQFGRLAFRDANQPSPIECILDVARLFGVSPEQVTLTAFESEDSHPCQITASIPATTCTQSPIADSRTARISGP